MKSYFPDLEQSLVGCELDFHEPGTRPKQFNMPAEKISSNFHHNDNDHEE